MIKWTKKGMNCIQKYLEGMETLKIVNWGKILGKCDRMKKKEKKSRFRAFATRAKKHLTNFQGINFHS